MNRLSKDDMERICRSVGLRPAKHLTIDGVDVYIADGFSATPHVTFQRLANFEPDEFPFGSYVSLYFTEGLPVGLNGGQPLFFDAIQMDSRNEAARMNATVVAAKKFIAERKKHH